MHDGHVVDAGALVFGCKRRWTVNREPVRQSTLLPLLSQVCSSVNMDTEVVKGSTVRPERSTAARLD